MMVPTVERHQFAESRIVDSQVCDLSAPGAISETETLGMVEPTRTRDYLCVVTRLARSKIHVAVGIWAALCGCTDNADPCPTPETIGWLDEPDTIGQSMGFAAYLVAIWHDVELADGTAARMELDPGLDPEGVVRLHHQGEACEPVLSTDARALGFIDGSFDVSVPGTFYALPVGDGDAYARLTSTVDGEAWTGPHFGAAPNELRIEAFYGNYSSWGSVIGVDGDARQTLVSWDSRPD